MYKRSLKAFLQNIPQRDGLYMCKALFGVAKYSELSFAIPTEINSTGAYFLVEILSKTMNEIIIEGSLGSSENSREINPEGISTAMINGHKDGQPKIIQKFGDRGSDQYSVRDIAHTIPSNPMSDRGQMLLEPAVLRAERTDFGKAVRMDVEHGNVKLSRHEMTELKPRQDGISNTLTGVQKDNLLQEPRFRIRKLTPRECFRLMGVPDANIDIIQQASISNCQQYKMAGNSIVVDCLEYIFDKLFVHKESEDKQLSLF